MNLTAATRRFIRFPATIAGVFFLLGIAEKGPRKLSGNFFVGPLPFFVLTRLLGKLERAAGWPKN